FNKLRDTILESDEAYDRLLAVLHASITKASTTNPALARDTSETARSFLESIGLADQFDGYRFRKADFEESSLNAINIPDDFNLMLRENERDEQALDGYLLTGGTLLKFLADSCQAEWIRVHDPKQYEERKQQKHMPSSQEI